MKETGDESWGAWAKARMTKENAFKAGALGLTVAGLVALNPPHNRAALRSGLHALGPHTIQAPGLETHGGAPLRDRYEAAWRNEMRQQRSY